MIFVRRADDIEHTPVLAHVAAEKRIEQFLQLGVGHIHRQAFDAAAFDFNLALGQIPLWHVFDLDRIIAQPLHHSGGQWHLDLIAQTGQLPRLQRKNRR